MADANLNESGESVEIIGEKQPRAVDAADDTLPTDESIEDADDSEDSSEEDSDEDSGEEKPVAVAKAKNDAPTVEAAAAAAAASASKPKEVAPRRSRRSNFGNRYEDTLKKEKEEDRMPTSLRNGSLLGG